MLPLVSPAGRFTTEPQAIATFPEGYRPRAGSLFFGGRLALDGGAESIFLEMRANNPAETLYRECGFEPIGRRVDYYRTADGTPLDAITFARKL